MKKYLVIVSALAMTATTASAGGIERRGDPSVILFEKSRNYVEFSVAHVDPSVSGEPLAGIPTGPTGNIQRSYRSFAGGFKTDVTDRLTLGLVIDEPVGVKVDYRTPPASLGGAFFGTSNAEISSIAITALAKYQTTDRFSVYGGLRYMGLDGNVLILSPATTGDPLGGPGPYSLDVDKDYQLGYLLGAAYEIPDIALRVALTYESETEHDFKDNTGAPFKVEIPRAVTLRAQTGIAANTLLFGSIRWREWTKFKIQPGDFFELVPGFGAVNVPIASEPKDIWTYELGIGRKFSENWSGAFILGYEKDQDEQVGNLSGKDGYISYGLAATYETDKIRITTGIRYFDLGDADSTVTAFSDNSALAVATMVGFKF